MVVSAKLEEEGALLTPEDRRELFEGLGLGEGALAKVVRAAYARHGLDQFLHARPEGGPRLDGAQRCQGS